MEILSAKALAFFVPPGIGRLPITLGNRGNLGSTEDGGVRHYVIEGDRLILTAKTQEMGEDRVRKLVWHRLVGQ